MITRRNWFSVLAAPFVARFLPKSKSITQVVNEGLNPAWDGTVRDAYKPFVDNFFVDSPLFARLKVGGAYSPYDDGLAISQPLIYAPAAELTGIGSTTIHNPTEAWDGAN